MQELARVTNTETIMRLPERTTLFRAINRYQNKGKPNVPQSIDALQILPPYDKTLDNEQLLQFDDGINSDRILMFYTSDGLKQLCNSRIVFADGTFKAVPRPFMQLYTFDGEVFDHVFPLAYGLPLRKTENTYKTQCWRNSRNMHSS